MHFFTFDTFNDTFDIFLVFFTFYVSTLTFPSFRRYFFQIYHFLRLTLVSVIF